jgi:hypothetical protein
MKNYQLFASVLAQLLGNDTSVRLTVNGYMPLSIENIGQSAEGNRHIAICHYGEQNGDMSAVGSCADNAAAESFFGVLKRERVN